MRPTTTCALLLCAAACSPGDQAEAPPAAAPPAATTPTAASPLLREIPAGATRARTTSIALPEAVRARWVAERFPALINDRATWADIWKGGSAPAIDFGKESVLALREPRTARPGPHEVSRRGDTTYVVLRLERVAAERRADDRVEFLRVPAIRGPVRYVVR